MKYLFLLRDGRSAPRKLARLWREHPNIGLCSKVLIVFIILFGVSWLRLDPDFGWHLQAGNYIRAHGIPGHDLFTYTARNFPWIDHEWGNDVWTSFLYQHGGFVALSVAYSSLWTAALFINGKKRGLFVLILATLALLPYAGIRPIAWTALGLALLLKITSGKNRYLQSCIPLIFIVWANLHAGFVIGLALIAYLAISKRQLFWAKILLLSILATFINVYGPRLYVEVARTLFDRSLHSQVEEWAPFAIIGPSWPYIISWMSGFWLFSKSRLAEWLRFDVLLLAAGFSSTRNVPLFIVASLSNTEDYLRKAVSMIPRKLHWTRSLVLAILVAAAAVSVLYGLRESYWPITSRETIYPTQAVAYLHKNGCPGNLFNDYSYGGYLIWKLPSVPVYIDGRMPSWRAPDGVKYIDTYLKVVSDKKVRQTEFNHYDIKCVLLRNVPVNSKMIKQLKGSGWQVVVEANGATLFIES